MLSTPCVILNSITASWCVADTCCRILGHLLSSPLPSACVVLSSSEAVLVHFPLWRYPHQHVKVGDGSKFALPCSLGTYRSVHSTGTGCPFIHPFLLNALWFSPSIYHITYYMEYGFSPYIHGVYNFQYCQFYFLLLLFWSFSSETVWSFSALPLFYSNYLYIPFCSFIVYLKCCVSLISVSSSPRSLWLLFPKWVYVRKGSGCNWWNSSSE